MYLTGHHLLRSTSKPKKYRENNWCVESKLNNWTANSNIFTCSTDNQHIRGLMFWANHSTESLNVRIIKIQQNCKNVKAFFLKKKKTNLNFRYISTGMRQFLSQSILALTSVQMREFFHSLPKKKSQSFPASPNISCFSSKFSPVLRFIFTFTQDTERAAAGERLLHARPNQQSRLSKITERMPFSS